MRILLVEDDSRLAAATAHSLRRAGFTLDLAARAAEAEAALGGVGYDAIVLDLGLPDQSGREFLVRQRQKGAMAPVIILSGRADVRDRIAGLNDGADDYLVKPFDMEELIARLRALVRRPRQAIGRELALGDLNFDTVSRQVTCDGRALALTRREIDLLEHLMRRGGRVVPKGLLDERLYGFDHEVASNSLEVAVHRLRSRLADACSRTRIHTIRGVGYLIDDGDKR